MAMNVIVKKQVLNFKDDKPEVYVASADRGDVIDTEKIAKFVAQDTGARPAQVKMILNSLIDSMMSWIEEGHGVRLGDLGSFLPSVKSDSSNDPNEVGVKRVKLTFLASKTMRERLGEVSFSTSNPYKSTVVEEDADTGSGGGSGGSGSGTEME